MNQQIETLLHFAVGGGIGFVLGYITARLREIKEELDEVDEIVKNDIAHRDDDGDMPAWQSIALGFVVLISAYAAITTGVSQSRAERSRCESGVESRNVQRKTVEAVYQLAIGAVQRDANDPPLTPKEKAQYNSYINRTNAFRISLYSDIRPSEQCRPYVDDDDVKPPTPPYPKLK